MAPGRAAINPEFVLDTKDIRVADVEEVRRPLIRRYILLLDFETNDVRILITPLDIVDRDSKAFRSRMFRCHRCEEVGGEGGYAAFAGQIIPEKGDFSNFRCCGLGLHAIDGFSTDAFHPTKVSLTGIEHFVDLFSATGSRLRTCVLSQTICNLSISKRV